MRAWKILNFVDVKICFHALHFNKQKTGDRFFLKMFLYYFVFGRIKEKIVITRASRGAGATGCR